MTARRVHLIGIGGIGLSAIARVLVARGDQVSGSDVHASPITDELARLGVQVRIGHRAENLGEAELVLVTSAASEDNPEVAAARQRGLVIVKRYDFFPELTSGKKTIAVAGTHGKTTTTGMIATILTDAGLDPTAIVGGMIPELNGNARAGQGDYFVIEADEYDRAFLGLQPAIAVVTSIEMDHPDIYADLDAVATAFREFMSRVPEGGIIVACGDEDRVARETAAMEREGPAARPVIRYGLGPTNRWRATGLAPNAEGGTNFVVWRGDTCLGEFSLRIPGRHNVLNALAALVVSDAVGVPMPSARETLNRFRGAARRFQVKGQVRGITVVDDYAHHPTEIRATLAAARERYPGRPVWAVFQPHTFSRTRALVQEFADAFEDADHVMVLPIFAARERDEMGVSGAQVVARMKHRDARFMATPEACLEYLEHLRNGDVLITLGAGDVYRIGEQMLKQLEPKGS